MADTKEDREKADDLNFELRQNISDAYGFIEGQKNTQTFATTTFEDLMDQQIERLVGADTDTRPNALHRVDQIEQRTLKAIAQIKQLPPEFFQARDDRDSVNTPTEGDDPYNGD